MSITRDGIVYELIVSAANGGPVYAPVSGDSDGVFPDEALRPNPKSPQRLYQGDTPPAFLIAGEHRIGQTPSAAWVARSQLLDQYRANVVAERALVEKTDLGDTSYFVARLLPEESAQLTSAHLHLPQTYYWSVEVENTETRYRRTVEVCLNVFAKP